MAAISLEELLGNVKAYQRGSEEATKKVVAALDTQADISATNVGVFQQQATDDTTIAAAKNAAEFATQLSRVKAANALGTNLKESGEVVTKLAATAQEAFERKSAALAEVQRKNNINFLEQPLEFIAAQFTVKDDIAEHNIANAQMQAAERRLMTINQLTQQTAITQNAISEPLTAAAMEASARSAAVAATVNANKARIDTISYGVQGIQYALNAKKEELAFEFQAKQATNAEESLQMQREGLELNKKEFQQRQYEFEQRRDDKKAADEVAQSVVDTINLGRKALLGPNATTMDDVTGKLVLSTLKGKGTLSQEMQKYYDAGERTRLAGTVVIGTTPAAAAETMQSVPVQLTPAQGPIKDLLSKASADTSQALKLADIPGQNKNPVFAGLDKKDKQSIARAYNGRAQELLNAAATVVRTGDSSNPYQIPTINQLAENSPTVQALPVYKKVLEPLVKAGVRLDDPKQIVSIVGEAVANGKISHKDAVELTTIYHVGVKANLAMRNFQGFGLAPSMSYRAEITTAPNAWNSTEIVDMTKPDAVSRALIKLQAGRLQAAALERVRPSTSAASKGTEFTTGNLFQPNPQATQRLEGAVNNATQSVDNFFNNLPTAGN